MKKHKAVKADKTETTESSAPPLPSPLPQAANGGEGSAGARPTPETRTESDGVLGYHFLPPTALRPDPNQPRKSFDRAGLEELARSIQEQGIIEPIIVRFIPKQHSIGEPDLEYPNAWTVREGGAVVFTADTRNECEKWCGAIGDYPGTDQDTYQIIAGERRRRAAQIAGLAKVPCLVRNLTEPKDILLVQLAENDSREPLDALDEAATYHRVVMVDKLFTADELAVTLGKSRSHVYGRLKLAGLPESIRQAVKNGTLNAALAELVAKIPGEKNQVKAMKEILEGDDFYDDDQEEYSKVPMSVREAKRHIRANYMLELDDAPFDPQDKHLTDAGACTGCPKRSDHCKDLFPGLKANICTDPDCFAEKKRTHIQWEALRAIDDGLEVVSAKETKQVLQYGGLRYGTVTDLAEAKVNGKPLKTLLGKDAPKPVAAIDDEGKRHTYYRQADLAEALKAKGIETAADTSGKQTKEQQEREAAERKARETLVEQVQAEVRSASDNLSSQDMKRLAVAKIVETNWYQSEDAFKACQLKKPMLSTLPKFLEALKDAKVEELLVALVLSGEAVTYDQEWKPTFALAAGMLRIDLAKREKEALAALDKPKAEPAKPAKGKKGKKK